MKPHSYISVFLLSVILFGCESKKETSNDHAAAELALRKKELELKEREISLKEKELAKENASLQSTPIKKNTSGIISPGFYILNVAAVKSEADARRQANELVAQGYEADYLWIPDYASLSGAQYFSVYIGPFSTQYECEVATENYKVSNPSAYGLLVSQENKRVQINGVGKVRVTDPYFPKQSYDGGN